MHDGDDDVRLMLALRAGDASAFDALFVRWSGPLLRYVERMVRDAASAEELVQETFLRMYRARERYEPDARFSTWLYTIATRLALLDQPEFQDPSCVKQLFGAIEAKESLLRILHKMIEARNVTVAFGEELGEPELRRLALVTAPYGSADAPLGVLGVIGPRRMDYPRVVSLVNYLSTLVSERLLP